MGMRGRGEGVRQLERLGRGFVGGFGRAVHFQFGDQKYVEHAIAVVLVVDDHGTSRLRMRKKVWMRHAKRAAISHSNEKGFERLNSMNYAKLFNGHILDYTTNGAKV
jgi:hypothetical protein